MSARTGHWFAVLGVAALELLELHGPDGQTAWVNALEISSLRGPVAADVARHFPKGTGCVVVMTNGKFLAVTEPCQKIRDMLTGQQR